MHPFLRSTRHFMLMWLFWSPIVFCTILLQSSLSGLTLMEASTLVGPPMVIKLFICISIWYPCKTFSPGIYKFTHVIIRHGLSAALMISVWLLAAAFYSKILSSLTNTQIWTERFYAALPFLLVTGLFLYVMTCLIYYLFLALEKSREAEKQVLESNLLASRAELNSLKSSIHPHFLFNSLAALSTLIRTSPVQAQKVCLQLSDFLHYSLSYGQQEWVHVKDEMEHVENYIGIEKIRLGERLKLDFSVDDDVLEEKLPPFSLMPLVENAVKHAFQQSIKTETLTLRIKKKMGLLFIEVKNPHERTVRAARGEGYGLFSLKKRLRNVYGNAASMTISGEKETFTVTLKLPLN